MTKSRFNTFLSLAKARKTVYKFSLKAVSNKDVLAILEATRWTPSCGNIQPWHFIVVRKKSMIQKLIRHTHFVFAPFIKPLPSAIIAFALPCEEEIYSSKQGFCCAFENCEQHKIDQERCLSMAVLQTVLAATDLGIGSCILTPSEKEASLLLKTRGRVLLLVALGYEQRNAFRRKRTRTELQSLVSYEHDGRKSG